MTAAGDANAGWRACIDHIIRPDSPCPVCTIEAHRATIERLRHQLEIQEARLAGYQRRQTWLISKLVHIQCLICTEDVQLPDGRRYAFKPPDSLVREAWEALSKAIREISIDVTEIHR